MTPNELLELTAYSPTTAGGYYVLHFAPYGRGTPPAHLRLQLNTVLGVNREIVLN